MKNLGTSSIIFLLLLMSSATCGQPESIKTSEGQVKVQTLAEGLNHPWGMVFLPDGRLIVTERAGRVRILNTDTTLTEPLEGTPRVFAQGQGGMLDVALDPDFANNKLVYLCFSEPGPNNTASTAVGRGTLEGNSIKNFTVIFRQEKVEGPNHFGGRLVFHEGKLFITMGDRFKYDPSQDLNNYLGTIARINPDGSIPKDNPFVTQQGAQDGIWSFGHRNIEAAAIDPATGKLWIAEMGPKGGDELNQPVSGENYGWPVVSWGEQYDGTDIPDPPTRPEFADAVIHWTPVISPSGMEFYTGSMFPHWKGKMLIGGLSSKAVVIVNVNDQQAKEFDRLDMNTRIRDVAQAPDGSIYLLTDQSQGKILRLVME